MCRMGTDGVPGLHHKELVGRSAELARLMDVIEASAGGDSRALHLYGDPGIGKTALLQAAVSPAERICAWGTADRFGERRQFGVLLEALGDDLHPIVEPIRQQGASTEDAVASAIIEEISRRLSSSQVVLVVDGLHWTDDATMRLLPRLTEVFRKMPFLLLTAGYRHLMPHGWRVMSDHLKTPRTYEMDLGPLSAMACASLAEPVLERSPTEADMSLLAMAGGNPLLIEKIAYRLNRYGRSKSLVGVDEPETWRTSPLSIAEVPQLHGLSPDCVQFLTLASLLTEGFDGHQLALVSGLTPAVLLPLVREAVNWGLLEECPAGLLRFRHPVIRATLHSELPAAVRSELHRSLAHKLDDEGAPAPMVAHHLLEAPVGWCDLEWVDVVALRCANTAPGVALALWEELLKHSIHLSDSRRIEIETNMALCHFSTGHLGSAARTAGRLLEGNTHVSRLSALRTCLGQSMMLQGRWSDARAQAESSALSDDLFPWERAEQAGLAGLAALLAGDAAGAMETSIRAEHAARVSGSDKAMIWVKVTRGHVAHLQGDLAESAALMREASRLAVLEGSRGACEVFAHAGLGLVLADMDCADEAREAFGEGKRLARERGSMVTERVTQLMHAWGPLDLVSLDLARTTLDDVMDTPDEVVEIWQPRQLARRALVEFFRDGPDAAGVWLSQVPSGLSSVPAGYGMAWLPRANAAVRRARGDAAGALLELWTAWQDVTRAGILVDCSVLAVDLTEAASRAGELEKAQAVARCLEDLAARNPEVVSLEVCALTCRGLADADPETLVSASIAARRSPRIIAAARAFEYAALAVAETRIDANADELGQGALSRYAKAGARFEFDRARADFRAAGIRVRQPVRSRPVLGWEALTPAERVIAGLVEQGLSNGEIARQRTVSRRTVETHVSHILAKLELRSRSDLIMAAARLGRIPRRPVDSV